MEIKECIMFSEAFLPILKNRSVTMEIKECIMFSEEDATACSRSGHPLLDLLP